MAAPQFHCLTTYSGMPYLVVTRAADAACAISFATGPRKHQICAA
jgi:hypothetical protein